MKKINKLKNSINNVDNFAKNSPETSINNVLDMNQQLIINVADASDPFDGLNLLQAKGIIGTSSELKTSLNNDLSNFIPLSGTTAANPITGDVLFNSNSTVTGLKTASKPTDAVNFLQSKQFFSNKYVALSGTITSSPITGDLYLDNTLVTGIKNAVENSEAVPLQQLQEIEKSLLPLSGGTITGPINMSSHKITNVPETSSPIDLVSLGQAKEKITTLFANCVPLTGTLPNKLIIGNILLNNTLISQLPLATEPSQIISLANLNTVSETLVPLNNPKLSGNIDLSDHLITNVAAATANLEGVNLQQFTTETHSLLPLSGGTMSVDLDMGNNTISSLNNTSLQNDDLINLATLTQYISTSNPNYIPLSGTVKNTPITGSLVFDSKHLITDISDPITNADAVNLKTLQSTMQLKLLLNGGTLTGPLNMNNHSITNLSVDAVPKDSDAANLGYLKNLFSSQKYIPLSGTTAEEPITGPLFFNNSATCTQIKNPEKNLDAMNLQTLQTTASKYLSLSGGTLKGTLDMNNHQILNIPNPINNTDLVSLSYLKLFSSQLVPLSSSTPIIMKGSINMNSYTFTNVPQATLPSELVNFIQVKTTLSNLLKDFIPFSETPTGSLITGNLELNNTLIKNIAPPTQSTDAITLLSLQTKFQDYLLLNGGTLTGNLNANNHIISGVQKATKQTNAATLNNLNTLLDTLFPLSGGTLTGTLNMNGNKIITLADPTQNTDAVNLSYLTTVTNSSLSQFIPFSGTIQGSPITGDLVLSNTSISNISAPNDDADAIQLQTLDTKRALYLPLSGGNLLGPLNMNSFEITGISEGTNLTNALTYSQMINNTSVNNYVLLNAENNITGTLTLNNTLIKNIPTTTVNTAAINLEALITSTQKYLPLTGGTLSGPINMNTSIITNLGDGTDTTDAANYGQLVDKVEKAFYIKTNMGENLNITWDANTNLNFTLSGTTNKYTTTYDFSSPNYSTYFNITPSKIYILKPGVFLFNVSVQSLHSSTDPATMGTFLTSPSLGTSINMNRCSQTLPLTLYLSTLLPLNNENITSTNTYLEVTNLSLSFAIKSLYWDITLLQSIVTTTS